MALQKMEEAAQKFKLLGDPTRLRILLILQAAADVWSNKDSSEEQASREEDEAASTKLSVPVAMTVSDVVFHLTGTHEISSTVSHHLMELRRAGLIPMKRRGKNILCRAETDALMGLEQLLCHDSKSNSGSKGSKNELA
jgi:DNA-binding transcriptional ArsR family regulator